MVMRHFGALSLLLGAVTLAGCGTQKGNAAGGEGEGGVVKRSTPQLVVFVYDRSTSISDHQLELARQLTNDRIRKLDHGDRIAAHQLLQLSLAGERLWDDAWSTFSAGA